MATQNKAVRRGRVINTMNALNNANVTSSDIVWQAEHSCMALLEIAGILNNTEMYLHNVSTECYWANLEGSDVDIEAQKLHDEIYGLAGKIGHALVTLNELLAWQKAVKHLETTHRDKLRMHLRKRGTLEGAKNEKGEQ